MKSMHKFKNLIQVGIRDISYNEYKKVCLSKNIIMFSDKDMRKYKINGGFDIISNEIISLSKDYIYLTIDIDGLDISLCPNTGTPVPGGLSFDQIINLLKKIKLHKKRIVGADICETADSSIDSIVSIRVLYKILGVIG